MGSFATIPRARLPIGSSRAFRETLAPRLPYFRDPPMRFLFVMDPAEGMLPDKDTTFAFLRAAQKRGHTSFHCAPRDLALVGSRVTAVARPLTVSATAP